MVTSLVMYAFTAGCEIENYALKQISITIDLNHSRKGVIFSTIDEQ